MLLRSRRCSLLHLSLLLLLLRCRKRRLLRCRERRLLLLGLHLLLLRCCKRRLLCLGLLLSGSGKRCLLCLLLRSGRCGLLHLKLGGLLRSGRSRRLLRLQLCGLLSGVGNWHLRLRQGLLLGLRLTSIGCRLFGHSARHRQGGVL